MYKGKRGKTILVRVICEVRISEGWSYRESPVNNIPSAVRLRLLTAKSRKLSYHHFIINTSIFCSRYTECLASRHFS